MDNLLNIKQLSELMGVPKATIYGWRYKSFGPPAIVLGRHLRWRREDVDAWLRERREAASAQSPTCRMARPSGRS